MSLTPEERLARRRAQWREYAAKNRDKNKAYMREWRAKNRERRNALNKLWRQNNRDKVRAIHRRKELADPQRHWRNKLKRRELEAGRPRPDCCEVCGGNEGRIAFDHCHQQGHFRGWLCTNCNSILGLAHDDANRLIMLAAYLKRTANMASPQLTLPGV